MFAPANLLRPPAKPERVLCRPGSAWPVLALAIALAHGAWALTALEPADGGAEFKIQGEYAGMVNGTATLGAQVVALGAGQFKAVFLPGGLPGAPAGQSGNGKGGNEATGAFTSAAAGANAAFTGSGYSGIVTADGLKFTGTDDKAQAFNLDKIMRVSPTEGAEPPSGATVLFSGQGVSGWKDGTASMDARGLFKPEGASAASGAVTKAAFQTFRMHLEFRLPFMPDARGQRRGNSGIYLQGRDELQVLDSFGNTLENGADTMAAKRECGAFFEYFPPLANAAYPPLSWQTYDIDFTAARYAVDGQTKLQPATARVLWNGMVVQDQPALANNTLLGDLAGPTPGPMRFQAYGDPVYYRNIWIAEGATAVRPRDRLQGKGGHAAAPSQGLRLNLINGRQTLAQYGLASIAPAADQSRFDSRPASGTYLFSGANGAGVISY